MKPSGWSGMRRFFVTALAAGLWSAAGMAQTVPEGIQGVYRGTLGRQRIVLEIGPVKENHRTVDAAGDEDAKAYPIEGRYFYARHGVGILLKGGPQPDGSLVLAEYQSMKATGGQWRLRFHGAEAAGSFCSCDVRKRQAEPQLEISLTRVSSEFDPELGWPEEAPGADAAYYDLLLEFPLTTGPEMRAADGIAWAMRSDPRFPVALPHLTRFPDAGVMERVNRDLDAELRKRRLRAAGCLSEGQLSTGGSWEEKTRVALLTRSVLSIVRDASWYCGGAYPDGGSDPLLYDLKTGKGMEAGALFVVGGSQTIKNGELQEGPAYDALMALYLRHRGKAEAGCEEIDLREMRPTIVFYLDPKGLMVEPILPHAMRGCAAEIGIPSSALQGVVRETIRHE